MYMQFKKATAAQEKALSLDPANSYINALSGIALSNAGKFKEAIPFLKKAIRLDPLHPNWYLSQLGLSYYKTGQFKEAISFLKEAINLSPYEATNLRPYYLGAHVGLAADYSLAERMEDARAQAAEVLRIDPEFSLEDIAKNGYYNFQKADKERFINALRKAGLK